MQRIDQMAVRATPFGSALRHWRRIRGVSQLELASAAATTTRHLSYLENGRSRPSREMVERLGDALGIHLRERNRLLETAGFAPAYPEGDLADDDLAPFRRIIERLLASHEPYPAFVVDRRWNLVIANRAAGLLISEEGPSNTIEALLDEWSLLIDNWNEVVVALRDRVADDLLSFPDDAVLQGLHRRVVAAAAAVGGSHQEPSSGRVICPRFRIDGQLLRTVTVAARFESTADVTLDEVRVELIYPEDAATERFFQDRADVV